MVRRLIFLLFYCLCPFLVFSQTQPLSQRMVDSFIRQHPDSIVIGNNKAARWDYEQGLMMKAIERVWNRTGDGRYYTYILNDLNQFVREDGSIRTYKADDFNIDNMPTGRTLLMLGQQTQPGKEKFIKAAKTLRQQLTNQPRNAERGFWHKKRYPNQMWLDGLYMGAPFYAEYGQLMNQPENFDDIALQFELIEKHALDPKTGLLYHAWDQSRQQRWANPQTGQSPNFWGRAVGWYAMALVDVLDYFPTNHPARPKLIGYLQRLAPVIARYQDKASGMWYQVMDQGTRKGNYLETSASSMFVYALGKGVRMGYLDESLLPVAKKGYGGIQKKFVETDETGNLHLNGTVSVGGLGGEPYRDGSYEYYLSEPLRRDDLKGVAPFIMASVEMEMIGESRLGKGKKVGLDYFFNHEFRPGAAEMPNSKQPEPFHYTWEDRMHSGFWLWGNTFRELGAATVSVPTAPTPESLKGLNVYIIVDPDTPKETAKPNYVEPQHIKAITDWVRAGGTLVLMANDSVNCELPHFNQLAAQFGVQFTNAQGNPVQGTKWEQGSIKIPAGNPVFSQTKEIYVKEYAPLQMKAPAETLVSHAGGTVMATAKLGRGKVFIIGDPWLYNEYTDGRRIPVDYENFEAGKELAKWLVR